MTRGRSVVRHQFQERIWCGMLDYGTGSNDAQEGMHAFAREACARTHWDLSAVGHTDIPHDAARRRRGGPWSGWGKSGRGYH